MTEASDTEIAVWVASRMASDAHATHRALESSLTYQGRMWEARSEIVKERILALISGDFMPTTHAIERALYVSDRDAVEWLEYEYASGDWRDPATPRERRDW